MKQTSRITKTLLALVIAGSFGASAFAGPPKHKNRNSRASSVGHVVGDIATGLHAATETNNRYVNQRTGGYWDQRWVNTSRYVVTGTDEHGQALSTWVTDGYWQSYWVSTTQIVSQPHLNSGIVNISVGHNGVRQNVGHSANRRVQNVSHKSVRKVTHKTRRH